MLAVAASFPEDNPFGRMSPYRDFFSCVTQDMTSHADVVNGELNKLLLTIENRTGKNVTVLSAAGEFFDPSSEQLIKTVRTLPWCWGKY